MNTGMLWYDSTKHALRIKVQDAVEYYKKKYGIPNLCLVHPSELENENLEGINIEVRPYRLVLPGHMWIGIDEQEGKEV